MRLSVKFDRTGRKMTIGDVTIAADDTPDAAAASAGVQALRSDTYASLHIKRPADGFGITLHFREDRLNVIVVSPEPWSEGELDSHRALRAMEATIESLVLPSWVRARANIAYNTDQPGLEFRIKAKT
jgi:hypothetical protein